MTMPKTKIVKYQHITNSFASFSVSSTNVYQYPSSESPSEPLVSPRKYITKIVKIQKRNVDNTKMHLSWTNLSNRTGLYSYSSFSLATFISDSDFLSFEISGASSATSVSSFYFNYSFSSSPSSSLSSSI